MKALTVCVEFDDLLALTLPRALRYFAKVLVITSPADLATQGLVRATLGAQLLVTDAFYRNGAQFNKGLALEEGFDNLGRDGWLCVFDADTVLPDDLVLPEISAGYLYCPRRRICQQPADWEPGADWASYPIFQDPEHAGFCQFFHASDPVLQSRPWYGTNWKTAAGCDSTFQARWARDRRIWLPFEVLHLGEPAKNWCGRCTPRLDGSLPERAAERQEALRQMWADRKRHGFARERLPRCYP